MGWFPCVFVFLSLFLPLNSALFNKTYGNLEVLSPGTPASLSSAQSWCRRHGSTLAEITSEHIWNLTLMFADEFELNRGDLILNANGEELPTWKWISGENFADMASYPLSIGTQMYACMSRRGKGSISVEESLPDCFPQKDCINGYVCEHKEVSRCNNKSHDEMVLDDICYVLDHDESVNWFEAYNECEKTNRRLVTFRNLKKNELQIATNLANGRKYWIGLNRYEWKWIGSGQSLTYTNFINNSVLGRSCVSLRFFSRKLHSLNDCTHELYKFICIKDTTQCASNPCRNGETCVGSIHNHKAGRRRRAAANKCDSNPCKNGGTCYDNVNYYTCRCGPGFIGPQCQTNINECSNILCKNGGSCYGSVNFYTC